MSAENYIDFDLEYVADDVCTVSRSESGEGRFIRHRQELSRYGHVRVIIAPHPGIRCYRFVWRPFEGSLPLPFMRAACLDGVKRALLEPTTAGRRIAFVEISVVDGSYHDRDTDEHSVGVAAYMAVRDALSRAPLVSV